jgi:hypothetical protein
VRSERQVDPLTVLANATRDDIAVDPVFTAIVERRERRRTAREIVARDTALAEELGIGQPGREEVLLAGDSGQVRNTRRQLFRESRVALGSHPARKG